jgi:hypothetical protein
MMIFGFELTTTGKEEIQKFNDNLNNPDKVIASRLFVGEISQVSGNFYVCRLDYIFPLPYIILVLAGVSGLIFHIMPLLYISVGLLIVMLFLSSKYFYYMILVWGLKRLGYKGKSKLLSSQDTIEKLLRGF